MRFSHVSYRLPNRLCPSQHADGTAKAWHPAHGALLAFALTLGAGCGADDPDSPAAGSGGSSGSAAGSGGSSGGAALDELAGTFTLQLVAEMTATATADASAAQTSFIGKLNDGETPVAESWKQDSQSGGCTLYVPKAPFCDPGCGSSAVCVSDDHCVTRPKAVTVGSLRLRGVGSAEIVMNPIANNYQPPAGTSLPYPPCSEGDPLTLAADGGAYTAFTLKASCISPLDFPGPVALKKGTPLALSWKAPGKPDLSRIQLRLDISHHGGSRGKIECDVADNGKLEIASAQVDKLLDLGVAGFPTVILTRIASGGSGDAAPKHVQFNVQQNVERAVEIEGLVSCADDSQCSAPKTCQSDLTCK